PRDADRVHVVEQRLERRIRSDPELRAHRRRALRLRIVEPGELGTRDLAKDARVVKAERPCADDADRYGAAHQITEPRSLRSKNARNSSISGNRCSSAAARSRACERLSSDLKKSR